MELKRKTFKGLKGKKQWMNRKEGKISRHCEQLVLNRYCQKLLSLPGGLPH